MMRIGKPIKQGSLPHGTHQLGEGPKTIGQAGCMLACMTMAARHIRSNPDLGILDAHLLIDQVDGFSGSGLILEKAARALGMHVDDRARFDQLAVATSLASEKPVIIGVDYKGGHSSGFSGADHFVLAMTCSTMAMGFADPATGFISVFDMQKPAYAGRKARLVEAIFLADAFPT